MAALLKGIQSCANCRSAARKPRRVVRTHDRQNFQNEEGLHNRCAFSCSAFYTCVVPSKLRQRAILTVCWAIFANLESFSNKTLTLRDCPARAYLIKPTYLLIRERSIKTSLNNASNGAIHRSFQCFFFALAHRAFAAFRAIWLRSSGVRASARILNCFFG
jgi:hypothetical protein